MNIFSSLNLNNNSVQNATIDTSKIGSGWASTEASTAGGGAIRYRNGVLEYSNGSTWQAVGTSNGMTSFGIGKGTGTGVSGPTEVSIANSDKITFGKTTSSGTDYLVVKKDGDTSANEIKIPITSSSPGPISVYTTNNFPGTTSTSNIAPIPIGTNSDPAEANSIKIQGDGKGKLTFSSTYDSGNYSVYTDVVKIVCTNLSVAANLTQKDFIIDHNFGTEDILVNTYFSQTKENQQEFFTLIQCDVELYSPDANDIGNKIKVKLRGNPIPEGILKVVIFGGNNKLLTPSEVGYVTPSNDVGTRGDTITPINPNERP